MQVLIEGDRLLTGPGAGALGLREARRRAGGALTLERLETEAFETRLAALYRDDGTEAGEDGLAFDLEEGAAGQGPRRCLFACQ